MFTTYIITEVLDFFHGPVIEKIENTARRN
jgi:hypothetical protein